MARTLSSLFISATGLPTRATLCSIRSSSRSLTFSTVIRSSLPRLSPSVVWTSPPMAFSIISRAEMS